MHRNAFSLLLILLALTGCVSETPVQHQESDYQIIPRPALLRPGAGYFQLDSSTTLFADESFELATRYLEAGLQSMGGIAIAEAPTAAKAGIRLEQSDAVENPEGYQLIITSKGILLRASDAPGAFYGVQTLLQLFRQQYAGAASLEIPCVFIEDEPQFPYRGMHLDVARHFFPVSFVKKYIDLLARYKLNRFHWHLTEDQGWRIEIKRYPKLQEVAAYRNETLIGHYRDQPHQFDGRRYGGYYTQEEIKEVVQYARERHITIIPEIEMPGHSRAALAAYPELGCDDGPYTVATKWGVFEEVYCPKEETFAFLEGVLTEVMELFPSEYIHIGGDECPKTAWENSAYCQELIKREGLADEHELQSYFIRRMEKFLNANGRQIIGWDEILEGGLAPNATVMSWRGEAGGIEAAKAGHQVIMTPTSHCYFDYYQADHPDEPLAIGGLLPLEKVYNYHPIPSELSGEEAKYILGAQGNLWTEYIPTPEKAEYMAFPRAIALAEVTWSGQEGKDFQDFVQRLTYHIDWLRADGVNVAERLYDVAAGARADQAGRITLSLQNPARTGQVRYDTIPLADPEQGQVYRQPVADLQSGTYYAQTFLNGEAKGYPAKIEIDLHKAAGADIRIATPLDDRYSSGGPFTLVNGVKGNDLRFGDPEWLGFQGGDFEATIQLPEPDSLQSVSLRFFHAPGSWIYAPRQAEVVLNSIFSEGPVRWSAGIPDPIGSHAVVTLSGLPTMARSLTIKVKNYGIIPAGSPGAGNPAWLFIDEIVVK